MSKETLQWLNENTLIGFTGKRGTAWHYRAALQGDEPNHYPGAIPVGDVSRRLFHWEPVEQPIYVPSSGMEWTPNGHIPIPGTVEAVTDTGVLKLAPLPDRKAIQRSDTGHTMGIFTDSYQPHEYNEWLINTIATLLDDDLSIGSAGLLKNGAVAWVSVEVPDNVTTPEGVEFRPHLFGATSFDGSLATTFKRAVTSIVCDNTMAAGMREAGQQIKIKHSRHSKLRIGEAREALNIIYQVADDFAAEVTALCNTSVSDAEWAAFLDAHVPMPDESGRSRTMAENKRDTLSRLWNHDNRVAPWKGTAWGVVQAVNTYTHHEQTVRGAVRAERNMLRAVTGGVDELDHTTLHTLATVQSDPALLAA